MPSPPARGVSRSNAADAVLRVGCPAGGALPPALAVYRASRSSSWLPRRRTKSGPSTQLDKAIQLQPNLAEAYYFRGLALLEQGKKTEGIADQVLNTAILDRLLHFSTTISIRGQGYCLREKRKAGLFTELAEPAKEVRPANSRA
jgi:IstB-like ATP binding protein